MTIDPNKLIIQNSPVIMCLLLSQKVWKRKKKRYFILDLESHHTPTWTPLNLLLFVGSGKDWRDVPRALGAGVVSGSGNKHLALQLREEIAEGRGPARPKGMSYTDREGEGQESY